jgi:hypothetical protein
LGFSTHECFSQREEVIQSVSPQLLAKRDWQHSINISPQQNVPLCSGYANQLLKKFGPMSWLNLCVAQYSHHALFERKKNLPNLMLSAE